MIIRLILIFSSALLSNSLLASSNNTVWAVSLSGDDSSRINSVFIRGIEDKVLFDPIGSANSQANSGEEYHTFKPGKEPLVTVWTLFPGPKSNLEKPTIITCKTATKFFLQHLAAKGCQKGA
jgi:hypothetical protein